MMGCGDKLAHGLADLPAILLTTPEGVPAIFQLHVLGLSNLEKFRSQILGDVRHLLLFLSVLFQEIYDVEDSLSTQGAYIN